MLRYCSIVLCLAVALLCVLGLVTLSSTSVWVDGGGQYTFVRKQVISICVGLALALIGWRMPEHVIRKYWPWALLVTCLCLGLVLVPGIGAKINGSRRWLNVPMVGQFQPSELARVVTVVAVAGWFARWQTETRTFWRGFILPGMIAGIPIGLTAVETNMGAALSMSLACALTFYCAGTRLRLLLPTMAAGLVVAFVAAKHNPNRWKRIEAWMDLEHHQTDQGLQQWVAMRALGNGGLTGTGLGNGEEKFGLPYSHVDFILPSIGEELGLVTTLGTVLCYTLIAAAGIGIASQAGTPFARVAAIGLTCMIVIPAMQNVAVTTACIPNDGLPLPFVSYGGSSIMFALASVGVLVGIHRRAQPEATYESVLGPRRRLAIRL